MYKIFYKEENILNVKESNIVPFILKNFGISFFNSLKIPFVYKPFPNEGKPLIDEGDLDLLLVNPKQPQFTYQLEFKRIKIQYDPNLGETINKLKDLELGIKQVKKRLDIGFHKCYLVIVSVFYGEEKEANNVFFKKASSKTLDLIYESDYLKQLDGRAGIVGLEVTQPTIKNFNEQCGMPTYVMRQPIPQRQPLVLTDLIERLYCR
jgi:hypothetical protein